MKKLNYRTTQLDVRGLNYHIHEWGDDSKPLLILLHGWMDCGASFKLMAPYLVDHFHLVAPDLRGFGDTEHVSNSYWFPDYYADLDALVDHFSPSEKVNLLGHSMGGHIVVTYAGLLNERVQKVMALDALGLQDSKSSDVPTRQRKWLTEIKHNQTSKIYANKDQLKTSIRAINPELSDSVVEELCALWSRPGKQDGTFVLKHDVKHRHTNPYRYIFSDAMEVWKEVNAETSIVMAQNSRFFKQAQEECRVEIAIELLNVKEENFFRVEKAGHMLHLEQPKSTADCVLSFFLSE